MMKFGRSLNLSLSIPLAFAFLAACTPAMTQQSAGENPAGVTQVQQPKALPAGTLNGLIANYDGKAFVPVAGALVKVEGTAAAAVTDSDGRYTISGVAPGEYTVSASKEGLEPSFSKIAMNGVMGIARVNLALATPSRSLQAITPFNATVSGVVTDPRGAALSAAKVRVLCNIGGPGNNGVSNLETSDINGFYTSALAGVAVNTLSQAQVQIQAWGTSPGQVKLETTDPYAFELKSSTLVANPQTKAFTQPGVPTFPNGTFSPMGSVATLAADNLSARIDEFYIEIKSGGQLYGVLPDSVVITAAGANGTPAQKGTVQFRIPFTLPSTTFTCRIMPFGLRDRPLTPYSTSFVTNYLQADLDTDLTYSVNSAVTDATIPAGINGALFVGSDTGRYKITFRNTSLTVSQDLRLEGRVPVGSVISAASVVRTSNGVAAASAPIPAASWTQPDGSGNFAMQGFSAPTQVVATPGLVELTIDFTSPFGLAKAALFNVTSIVAKMLGANLTKTVAPSVTGNLTVANIDPATFTMTKAIADNGVANDGIGRVTLTLDPGAGGTAHGAYRIIDVTKTDQTAAAGTATFTGTVTQVAPGTAIGLTTADVLVFKVDGGAPTTVQVFSNNYDLETLNGQLNLANAAVFASRDGANKFRLIHKTQGTNKTIEVVGGVGGTTANMLAKLGIVAETKAGTDGILAEFASPAATATIAGGTAWTVTGTTLQNADGSVTANLNVVPPAAYGGAGPTSVVTVTYWMKKSGASPSMTIGGGGVSAPFGARMASYNTAFPYTDTTRDQQLNKNTGGDGASTANL